MEKMSGRKQSHPIKAKRGNETGKIRKINKKRLILVITASAFALYFIYIMIWQQVMISRKNKEIDALEEKINTASQQTEELQKELDNLDDPEYLERIARERLGLVRPNERVFVDANKDE